MIKLADDIDVSVSVCAIGLLKQLLRHQLLSDEDLGPLYDLLIDEPPEIRTGSSLCQCFWTRNLGKTLRMLMPQTWFDCFIHRLRKLSEKELYPLLITESSTTTKLKRKHWKIIDGT
ncbi:hypothetical protein MKW98_008183 [Papaver atlanticum]|uniref:Uncharacterized protein n=1 Tax=Papaver atlanticum TaxID=357466 RepID=A0AAD4RVZ6_9MAGN|nr:hypothetical protein MKW98_008183 [Papaver atlanticum]